VSEQTATQHVNPRSVPWSTHEHLQDPAVKAEYDALEDEFALIRQLIDLRIKRGLSQRQLAERAKMQQPTIARLEGGQTASLRTLRRVADALDADVKVTLVPRRARSTGKGKKQM
jgi:ribosome-binding protein aMBF1 (putative translation factor)